MEDKNTYEFIQRALAEGMMEITEANSLLYDMGLPQLDLKTKLKVTATFAREMDYKFAVDADLVNDTDLSAHIQRTKLGSEIQGFRITSPNVILDFTAEVVIEHEFQVTIFYKAGETEVPLEKAIRDAVQAQLADGTVIGVNLDSITDLTSTVYINGTYEVVNTYA